MGLCLRVHAKRLGGAGLKIFQTEFRKLKLTDPETIVSKMNFIKYVTRLHSMQPAITTGKTTRPFHKY